MSCDSCHSANGSPSLDVLRCIDGAVPFPIVFELSRGDKQRGQTQVVAAYKRPNESDASRRVLSDHFATAVVAE